MRNLISMTDFVLEQELNLRNDFNYTNKEALVEIFNYANFLKQPLELWMFIPCDEEVNVLEEPKNYVTWLGLHESKGSTIGFTEHEKYQKAKERCLFDGFELDCESIPLKIIRSEFMPDFLISFLQKEKLTIEYLVKYNLQLTQTAIKKLGL